MKIKKYIANSMPEAMKKIRRELGNDAVILNSKEVETGGFFGFFMKKNIEVIAAIDPTPVISKKPIKIEKKKQYIEPISNQELDRRTKDAHGREKNNELLLEIQQLKQMVKDISSDSVNISGDDYPLPLKKMNKYLTDQDIGPDIRIRIMNYLLKKWYSNDEEMKSDQEIKEWLEEVFTTILAPLNMGGIDYKKQFVNFIGPTGVGKTTTVAKIAAISVLKHKKKVALITTDTFRIAAVEQLKTYANILNIPLEVAYNIEDFLRAKEQFADYDLVLVDSAGRNFRNEVYVEELKKIINFDHEMETYLVLSLTSKYQDMEAIINQFSSINIEKVIFTKKDETYNFGTMINLLTKQNVGLAYITNGQNVPDDIIEASPSIVMNILLDEVNKNE
ncbi:flagellar biosynthesis protein FlhF [Anaerobacillus sp. MEB173]|uniref:flagellar biosynthesis protein FlhF n=1 Tax=Anaerobacillus sp. MEB173 TaxID=3383345 RepID=UPI003F8DDC37